jgi:hypothetical protein
MKPHKHAELIKAWADGAEIEVLDNCMGWKAIGAYTSWHEQSIYRIKPEPKPDIVECMYIENINRRFFISKGKENLPNLKLTFDGETYQLKSAEVLE